METTVFQFEGNSKREREKERCYIRKGSNFESSEITQQFSGVTFTYNDFFGAYSI